MMRKAVVIAAALAAGACAAEEPPQYVVRLDLEEIAAATAARDAAPGFESLARGGRAQPGAATPGARPANPR